MKNVNCPFCTALSHSTGICYTADIIVYYHHCYYCKIDYHIMNNNIIFISFRIDKNKHNYLLNLNFTNKTTEIRCAPIFNPGGVQIFNKLILVNYLLNDVIPDNAKQNLEMLLVFS